MAARTVLNIEVGDHITKVCHSAKKGKGLKVLNSFMFTTPDQSVSDGMIVDPKGLAEALREQLVLNHASHAKSVTFTLTTSKVASREVLLPPMRDQRIKEVVETNARDYFPVDMSNYQVAFNLLEKVTAPEPGSRVLVMAAPKPLLVGYFRLAEQAGLNLTGIDYAGNSQYQLLSSFKAPKLTMFIDINLGSTMITFMRGSVLLLQRTLNFGGDELVSAVHRAHGEGVSFLDALGFASDETILSRVLSSEDRSDALARLVTGISRTADFYSSSHSNERVEDVVIFGVCSHISGLREMIANSLGLESSFLEEIHGVSFPSGVSGGISPYISCIGSYFKPINLMPEDMRRRGRSAGLGTKKKRESMAFGLFMCIICVVAGAATSWMAFSDYLVAADKEVAVQKRLTELSYVTETYDTYMSYRDMAGNLEYVKSFADTPNAELTAFFDEMEKKMPSSILVLSAVCSNDGITMNITAPGMEEAAVIISQLRMFESVDSISVSTITESTDETGFTTTSFSVSCIYVQRDSVEAPDASNSDIQ